ncbi:MAG: LysM peptidoglycan-binding domain-containing protein [Pseudomonadota bacterium]|nr:LysM peptidoglycan-binding domain-containing protein [Pseudomonadota bacterium]
MRFILYMLFVVGGMLVVLALGVVFFGDDETAKVAPQTQSIDLSSKTTAGPANTDGNNSDAPQDGVVTPGLPNLDTQSNAKLALRIDVARVKPDGAAVVAGSAPPGALIRVFEDRILLGKTTADRNGEWVVVLEKRLAVGQHLISVAAELEDDSSIMAETSLAIEIYANQSAKPLVALLPEKQSEMPMLLQSPDTDAEKITSDATPMDASAQVGPRSLVWLDETELSIGGQSRGGVRVMVSANGTFFSDALALADGSWQVTGKLEKNRNIHRFEFVLVDNAGQVMARHLLPVRTYDLQKGLDGSQLVVVNKGDALWRIAYRSFGKGVRYIDIVRKNTGDIENPDLIYPNQIFALPKSDGAN